MSELTQTATWGVGATLLLIYVYQHIRLRWPQNYFGPAESFTTFFTKNGWRYFAFRFLPPYAAFTLIAVYGPADRSLSVAFATGFYISASTILSITSSLRREKGSARLTVRRGLALAAIACLIAAAGYAAYRTGDAITPVAPQLSDVLTAVLAAVISTTLAIAYLQVTLSPASSEEGISESMAHAIRMIALDHGVDPQLAIAIAAAENAQRPPWFRRLERLTARLRPLGSYGLFQVRGHGPVTDIQSCRIAMAQLKGTYPPRVSFSDGDWIIRRAAENHNPDAQFAEMVAQAYPNYPHHALESTAKWAEDMRPNLEVIDISRFGESVVIRGSYWAPLLTPRVRVRGFDTGADWNEVRVRTLRGPYGRATWRVDTTTSTRYLEVTGIKRKGRGRATRIFEIDLVRVSINRDITLAPGTPQKPQWVGTSD